MEVISVRGRADARARNAAGVDLVADDDVDPRLGRGRGIDAGEAAVEQQPGVVHRLEDVLFGRNFAEVGELRDVGEGDVTVGFDEARHQARAAAVDHLDAAFFRNPIRCRGRPF